MITLKGRDILAKYLVGQIASYASHIAIGCGPLPTTTSGNYINKTELDFEMGRFPITSRSIVADTVTVAVSNISTTSTGQYYILTVASHNFFVGQKVVVAGAGSFTVSSGPTLYSPNNIHTILSTTPTTITVDFGQTYLGTTISPTTQAADATVSGIVKQISLTAELPYSGRYEITELGLYSSAENPYVSGVASQTLSNFLSGEAWKLFTYSTTSFTPLETFTTIGTSDSITVSAKAFRTNSDNTFFDTLYPLDASGKNRVTRQERPRFLQDTIILSGDLSDFTAINAPATTANYIQLDNFLVNLGKNNPDGEIRIAYSLINSVSVPTQTPRSLNIMVQFLTNSGEFAEYHFRDTDATSLITGSGPYASNRYKIKSLPISSATIADGSLSSGFSWSNVTSLRIFAGVESATTYGGTLLTDYDICLDGIRIENKSNTNPLYGLVGYTVINTDTVPLIKNDSMSHQVEFRYVIGETDNV